MSAVKEEGELVVEEGEVLPSVASEEQPSEQRKKSRKKKHRSSTEEEEAPSKKKKHRHHRQQEEEEDEEAAASSSSRKKKHRRQQQKQEEEEEELKEVEKPEQEEEEEEGEVDVKQKEQEKPATAPTVEEEEHKEAPPPQPPQQPEEDHHQQQPEEEPRHEEEEQDDQDDDEEEEEEDKPKKPRRGAARKQQRVDAAAATASSSLGRAAKKRAAEIMRNKPAAPAAAASAPPPPPPPTRLQPSRSVSAASASAAPAPVPARLSIAQQLHTDLPPEWASQLARDNLASQQQARMGHVKQLLVDDNNGHIVDDNDDVGKAWMLAHTRRPAVVAKDEVSTSSKNHHHDWAALDAWTSKHAQQLKQLITLDQVLDQNHRDQLVEEFKALRAATAANAQQPALLSRSTSPSAGNGSSSAPATSSSSTTKRYPSRNNPTCVVGSELGAVDPLLAEEERKERERRKNAAVLPSVLVRTRSSLPVLSFSRPLTTDIQPARCQNRGTCGSFLSSTMLLVPAPTACNCSRAAVDRMPAMQTWSDVERSIFLDRFLQFPKDFQRIAAFLPRKRTEDAVAFYYQTKKRCDYKAYLGEHHRRKNREPSEFAAVRENYLRMLGVRLPLSWELDGRGGESRSVEPAARLVDNNDNGNKVCFERRDVLALPVQGGQLVEAGWMFPRPAVLADFPVGVDSEELKAWVAAAAASATTII